jgi:Lon protease-like protein
VTRLPLFPLPVVLLPGSPLPLHIFEARYQRLVTHCREREAPFGIVYHDPDVHGPFLTEEGRVGTEARIEAYDPLPDGRSLILTRGGERFAIREELESTEPYYEAVVEAYTDLEGPGSSPTGAPTLVARRARSLTLLRAAVTAMGGSADEVPSLDSAGEVSFQLARSLQIAPSWLQALLELRDESARLERLDTIFRAAAEGRFGSGGEARGGPEPPPG